MQNVQILKIVDSHIAIAIEDRWFAKESGELKYGGGIDREGGANRWGLWKNLYRVLIYLFVGNLWRIDSGGQNKQKRYYSKTCIKL